MFFFVGSYSPNVLNKTNFLTGWTAGWEKEISFYQSLFRLVQLFERCLVRMHYHLAQCKLRSYRIKHWNTKMLYLSVIFVKQFKLKFAKENNDKTIVTNKFRRKESLDFFFCRKYVKKTNQLLWFSQITVLLIDLKVFFRSLFCLGMMY